MNRLARVSFLFLVPILSNGTGCRDESGDWVERLVKAIARDGTTAGVQMLQEELRSCSLEGPEPLREVIVLTPRADYNSSLERWRNVREAQKYKVVVHDLEVELGAGPWTPHQVRDFLKARYLDGRIRYLLIVGDHGQIPMMAAISVDFPETTAEQPVTYTDHYYSDLKSDWDSNKNGIWGEADDDINHLPEFLVGRIPAFNPEEAEAFLRRQLVYERQAAPVAEHAILVAGTIETPGDAALIQQGAKLLLESEEMKTTTVYDTDTFVFDSLRIPVDPDYLLGGVSVPDLWSNGDQELMCVISHGDANGLYASRSTGSLMFGIDDTRALQIFPKGGFLFAVACAIAGPVEGRPTYRKFAESLLFDGKGTGVGAATNLTYYGSEPVAIAGALFAELIYPYMVAKRGTTLGLAMSFCRVNYFEIFYSRAPEQSRAGMHQNLLAMQLFGDPTVRLRRV